MSGIAYGYCWFTCEADDPLDDDDLPEGRLGTGISASGTGWFTRHPTVASGNSAAIHKPEFSLVADRLAERTAVAHTFM
jgi:hypothetical protein